MKPAAAAVDIQTTHEADANCVQQIKERFALLS
jgi:hypothetical protein